MSNSLFSAEYQSILSIYQMMTVYICTEVTYNINKTEENIKLKVKTGFETN